MQFVTVRDFRGSSKGIWEKLRGDEEIVVTNNGRPTALLLGIPEGGFDDTVSAVRQAKAMRDFAKMREEAAERGFLSEEAIEAEIRAYRAEKRAAAAAAATAALATSATESSAEAATVATAISEAPAEYKP